MKTETTTLRELRVRYSEKKDSDGLPVAIGRELGSPAEAAATLMSLLADEPVEVFAVLLLTTKRRVIAYHEVARGTIDATLAHPREVFKAALLANAAAIIVAHNHPSGDPLPSPDDIHLTTRLSAAGDLLGVPLLDHIIVAGARYYSFKEGGHVHGGCG